MTVIGNPRSFHKKFKFIVEIDDVGHAGFQKCSELSVEVANVQYFEGGSLIPNKSPGRLTFSDVTLERGATEDRDLFDWFQDVAITSSVIATCTLETASFASAATSGFSVPNASECSSTRTRRLRVLTSFPGRAGAPSR